MEATTSSFRMRLFYSVPSELNMCDLKLSQVMTEPSLAPALKPAFPKLLIGTLIAVLSGLAMLTALWGMVQLIGNLSAYWVIFLLRFGVLVQYSQDFLLG